jgi:4-azaleucine resistance transporter AzlC
MAATARVTVADGAAGSSGSSGYPVDGGATAPSPSYAAEWRRGLLAMVPLWAGVVPFGASFGVIAREAGFGPLEAQLASVLVFAGSAQMAMVALYDEHAAPVAIVLTALVLNLRHVLYGLSLRRVLPAGTTHPPLRLLAFFLTDESFGIAVNDARSRVDDSARHRMRRPDAFLCGASLSLYAVFVVATLAGVTLGAVLPDAESLGLEMVFPLSFLALLLPLLRSRRQVGVALVAAALAIVLGRFGGGAAVLGATLGGAGLGAWLDGRQEATP